MVNVTRYWYRVHMFLTPIKAVGLLYVQYVTFCCNLKSNPVSMSLLCLGHSLIALFIYYYIYVPTETEARTEVK